jgi:hypothetical protein
MNEHVDPLQTIEGFNDRKRQIIQIVGIKKREMQSLRSQTLNDFAGRLFGFTNISNWGGANRTKARFRRVTTFFRSIGNVDFGELHFAVPSTLESDERAPIDFLLRVTNERSTTSAIQIDICCSTGALDKFLSNRARNTNVFAKALMLFFCPSTDFVEWQTVVVQHHQPPDFSIVIDGMFAICSTTRKS